MKKFSRSIKYHFRKDLNFNDVFILDKLEEEVVMSPTLRIDSQPSVVKGEWDEE